MEGDGTRCWAQETEHLSAAGSRCSRRALGHERARERRWLSSVLVKDRREPRKCAIALGEADSVDRQVVDKPDVKDVRGIPTVTHARGRFLRQAQE